MKQRFEGKKKTYVLFIHHQVRIYFIDEMKKSEEKRKKFSKEIYFPYPHGKLISSISKENADEIEKHFRRIVTYQTYIK